MSSVTEASQEDSEGTSALELEQQHSATYAQSCFRNLCAPQASEIHASFESVAGRAEIDTKTPNSQFTFYIHEDGAFNFSNVTRCYMEALGMRDMDDFRAIDNFTNPGVAEHMGDVSFLLQLQEHPQRTFDVDEASLHIIGSPVYLSFQALRFPKCGDLKAHEERVRAMKDQLLQTEAFKAQDGANFLIHFSSWQKAESCAKSGLLELLERGKIIVATSDIAFTSRKTMRWLVIPYRAAYVADEFAKRSAYMSDPPERPTAFMFHGNLRRRSRGQLRATFLTRLKDELFLHNTSFVNFDFKGASNLSFEELTYEAYTRSIFCIILPGDTMTSRRLFDAMSSGCIPVLFGHHEVLARNMPFHKSIDWTQNAVFAGDMSCNTRNVKLASVGLECVLGFSRWDRKYLDEFRLRVQAIYNQHLSYARGSGLVSAVLCEVNKYCHHASRIGPNPRLFAQMRKVAGLVEDYNARHARAYK